MSMLLKPSYTTQDSEKVEDEEADHQQSTITKMLNAATIKPPLPLVALLLLLDVLLISRHMSHHHTTPHTRLLSHGPSVDY